jgi:hypothetical protein
MAPLPAREPAHILSELRAAKFLGCIFRTIWHPTQT